MRKMSFIHHQKKNPRIIAIKPSSYICIVKLSILKIITFTVSGYGGDLVLMCKYSGIPLMRTPWGPPLRVQNREAIRYFGGLFPVGVAMRIRAVERSEATFQSSPLWYAGEKC